MAGEAAAAICAQRSRVRNKPSDAARCAIASALMLPDSDMAIFGKRVRERQAGLEVEANLFFLFR